MSVRSIKIEDFNYNLPDNRIALHPLSERDRCKLIVSGAGGKISHLQFFQLPLLLRPETLIVANETKVIRARIEFVKDTGARIEIFLLEPLYPSDYVSNFASTSQCSWVCLVGNKKRWKEGALEKECRIGDSKVSLKALITDTALKDGVGVGFSWDNPEVSFAEILDKIGNIPIPPYLKRESEESDTEDYQTVYSRIEGSVAAPTAGLHFTPELIGDLRKHGNGFATVTLHVGAGTFQPVKSDEIGDHPMHSEWISVSRATLARVVEALENGHDIMAVGTTSVRTLESLPYIGKMIEKGERELKVTQWMPYEPDFSSIDTLRSLRLIQDYLRDNNLDSIEADTSIMIAPGFRWRIVNRLVTNFHQPKSTLLLLVSSFMGRNREGVEKWRILYEEALKNDYRFLSYGDACFLVRSAQKVELPAAKSMVIRAASIYAVSDPSRLDSLMDSGLCDDSEYYIKALKSMLHSRELAEGALQDIYIGEGAAPLRFLVAIATSMPGVKIRITCAPGLQKRPVKPLVDVLKDMGADLEFNDAADDWNIIIRGRILRGGTINVDSSFTSQFVSALLLASPLWSEKSGLVPLNGATVSRPYVRLTEEMMAHPAILPEPDWSAAAFFYEYALITGKEVEIASLVPPSNSLQGDSVVCDVYSTLGVNSDFHKDGSATLRYDSLAFRRALDNGPYEFDFTDSPDMVPSVAVALCYRRLPFRFKGVNHLRFKECDRLSALQSILVRLGYEVTVEDEMLVFNGEFKPYEEFPMEIDPYGDHRIAMAFYPLELMGMATISDKSVVSKSFPNFYQQF